MYMSHAYVLEGDRESGIATARRHAEESLNLRGRHHPDVVVLSYGLFSVDDAREVARFASSSPISGDVKMVVIAATRIFHEAQNALLKLFEEPPQGVTMILIVPSLGQLLPTLRSRTTVLTSEAHVGLTKSNMGSTFLALDASSREKFLNAIIDKTKSDKDEVKQEARGAFLALVEDLARELYARRLAGDSSAALATTLADVDAFLPILHERSAPLKLIAEHLLLVLL